MAYHAVADFKRLDSSKRAFSRRRYTLLQAEKIISETISQGLVELKRLNELKKTCLTNPHSREELTDTIYSILVDQGIDVDEIDSIQEAAEILYAEIYGYSIFQPFIDDPQYNECYFNTPWDCWGIVGLERKRLDIQFRDENHATELLKRLTDSSREGKAAHDNRLNSAVLADGIRLRWALPPVADHVSANLRKHTVEDMQGITPEKYIQENVMTRPVYSLLSGMAIMGICYGLLGPGGIGKTALLRVILKEVQDKIRPRFLVSENGSELNLREYLLLLGCKDVDVNSLQKWSGPRESLKDIFANFMQAKGEYIIQPEVLMPDEVDNILMARRRGHIMGPFTFHSYPNKFNDALTDLYLQGNRQADRDSIKRMLADDVVASCYYDVEYTPSGKKRRVYGIYEHINGNAKPIFEFNQNKGDYTVYPIENEELRKKLKQLKFIAPNNFKEVQFLL